MDNFKLARRAVKAHNLQPASARYVLLSVAVYINGDPAYPSYQTLAEDTGLSPYQARRYVDALVEQGYLTESRTARKGGGWGKPQWALGPRCQVLPEPHLQVVAEQHLPQEQVWAKQQSSVAPPTHASVAPPTPKRIKIPTTVGSEGGVGVGEESVEERKEERAPRPPTNKNSHVIDGLKAKDYLPDLKERDHQAIKRTPLTAEQIVEVYDAYASGRHGDQWHRNGLTVATAIGFWDRYQADLKAKRQPSSNGPSAATLARLRRHEEDEARERNLRRERPTTPSPL